MEQDIFRGMQAILVPAVVFSSILVMFRIISPGTAFALILGGAVVCSALPSFISSLPGWCAILVMMYVLILSVRLLLAVLIGKGAGDRVVAALAYNFILIPFRMLGGLVRFCFGRQRR